MQYCYIDVNRRTGQGAFNIIRVEYYMFYNKKPFVNKIEGMPFHTIRLKIRSV